jgi:hypothetical protein
VTVDIVVVPECIHIGIAFAEVAAPDFVPAVEAVPAVVVHDAAARCSAAAKLVVMALAAVQIPVSTPVQ